MKTLIIGFFFLTSSLVANAGNVREFSKSCIATLTHAETQGPLSSQKVLETLNVIIQDEASGNQSPQNFFFIPSHMEKGAQIPDSRIDVTRGADPTDVKKIEIKYLSPTNTLIEGYAFMFSGSGQLCRPSEVDFLKLDEKGNILPAPIASQDICKANEPFYAFYSSELKNASPHPVDQGTFEKEREILVQKLQKDLDRSRLPEGVERKNFTSSIETLRQQKYQPEYKINSVGAAMKFDFNVTEINHMRCKQYGFYSQDPERRPVKQPLKNVRHSAN